MSRRWRRSFTFTSFLAALLIIMAVAGCGGGGTSGGGVAAQSAPTSTTPSTTTPTTTTPSTPSSPGRAAAADPVLTLQTAFGAIQANDLNTLQGIVGTSGTSKGSTQVAWGSNDLNAYVGNTNFDTALSYVVVSNDGSSATVHVRGVMTFHDPGHSPETPAPIVVYDIAGNAKLAASGGSWVVIGFPNIFPRGFYDNSLPITAGLKTAA